MQIIYYLLLTGLVLSACNTDNTNIPEDSSLNLRSDHIPQVADSSQIRTIRIRKSGEDLFEQNCGSCHSVKHNLTGPALKDITKKHSRAWLYAFTKDSQAVIASGDEYAIALYKTWGSVMTAFPDLDSMQIMRIYDYIEAESAK